MTPELTVLALAALLQGVQFTLMAIPTNIEVGVGKTMSPRDNSRLGKPLLEQVSDKTGRLIRAMNNHFEALILFTIAVVVITLGDKGTGFSAICAWTYLGARILYIPAYYFGLAPWRSLIWFVGFLSTMLMILSALI
ncbi:MAPEG family protein [Roseobacter sp. CCS2]|uniref:MAPEG family protein n=1 Tax=Roseobacter sp. CCS2 TaxID=391593 RepID=UPI0000F3E5CA|nr:MAPEG family protein [Roseobacter sp. CCS2]EBA12242.1 inner membrane protein [Roseobacter sp. CCS2]